MFSRPGAGAVLLRGALLLIAVASLVSTGWTQSIPAQIDAILARSAVAGNSWTILVENADGAVIHYARNPATGLAPASNTKMFTTAAALGLLGTNYAFETRIYRDGALAGGVLNGNLNLVSEHDITWNTSVFSGNARRGLDHIATRLKSLGLTAVNGNVQCYGVCIYNYGSTANTKDTQNQAAYNAQAATAFKAALEAQGIAVSGSALGQTGFNPSGALFHTHRSSDLTYGSRPLRLDVACIPLNRVSHNPMADALLRHIGWKLSGTDSFAAGRNRVLPWLRNTADLSTNGIVMNDGSGLSSGNRFSAQQTLSLVRYMLGAFPTWAESLPVGCVNGTIGSRFCGTDGAGQVHAKTGSLSSSIALSGYIDNKHDNQRYLFSFIANKSGIDQTATRRAIDDCVVLLGARGVPFSPQLLEVVGRPNGRSIRIAWSDEGYVRTGYRLYASDDGVNFGAPIQLAPATHSHIESGLAEGAKRYYKVSVAGAGGESKPSRSYSAQTGPGTSPILIVDGNDRWQFIPAKNPFTTNHNFAALVGRSISGPAFDTAHHNAVISGRVSLTNYHSVIWVLGEESTADRTFDPAEQAMVTAYLNAGGNLFVSGAEIGWDLDRDSGPTAADRNFYRTQLRARLNGNVNDNARTYSFAPAPGGIFDGNAAGGFDNGAGGTYDVRFPDVLTPVNGSVPAINYVGGLGGAAAVQYDGSLGGGRVVNLGFPFETITNSVVREAYMSDVLRFFGLVDPPLVAGPRMDLAADTVTLTWNASAGLRYRVQYKNHLSDTHWFDLAPDITAAATTASKTDAPVTTQRFYRVILVD